MRFEPYEIPDSLKNMLAKVGRHDLIESGFDVDESALAISRGERLHGAHAIYHALFSRRAVPPVAEVAEAPKVEVPPVIQPVAPPVDLSPVVAAIEAESHKHALWQAFQSIVLVAIMIALIAGNAHCQGTSPLTVQLQSGGVTLGTRASGLLKLNCSTATFTNNTWSCTPAAAASVWPSAAMYWPFGVPAGLYSGSYSPWPGAAMGCQFVPSATLTVNTYYFQITGATGAGRGFVVGLYDSAKNLIANSSAKAYYGSGVPATDLSSAGVKYIATSAAITLAANTVYYLAWGSDNADYVYLMYASGAATNMDFLDANGFSDCGQSPNSVTGSGNTIALPATLGAMTTFGSAYKSIPIVGTR